MKISKVGSTQKVEAVGMFSSDGEYVEFSHSVTLEGPVEAWLCDIERTMRWTLKEYLKFCRIALKKVASKREKWVKEWAGQVRNSFQRLKNLLLDKAACSVRQSVSEYCSDVFL